jgi:hypothetical protein
MNINRYRNLILGIACGLSLISCAEKYNVGNVVDKDAYLAATQNVAGVRNSEGKALFTTVETTEEETVVEFSLQLNKPAEKVTDAVISVGEASVIENYNAEHGTSYVALSPENVSIYDEGLVVVFEGESQSDPVEVTITTDEGMSQDVTYAFPLKVTSTTQGVHSGKDHIVFVKNCKGKKFASSAKPSGIKLFSCMETGSTNPLFHKSFMLERSGLPLFDVVILFSAKIVYDKEECRLKIWNTPAIAGIIQSDVVKQLHDYGMKVIVSILGSDDAGVAHLTDAACKTFAQEIANYCEAYDLDGVFFDDEYTYSWNHPGLTNPSRDRAARLCYETKMAMPDKMVTCYIYGRTYGFDKKINGMEPGDFVDYAISDYGSWDTESGYLGMERNQVSPCSANFASSYARWTATQSNLQRVRNSGYGGFMVYCLTFHVADVWNREMESLRNIARYLYDDTLVFTGEKPEPTW